MVVGKKRYVCSFCERPFSRSEHRSRHERSHTGSKPYGCKICSRVFVRRDLLQRHVRTVHRTLLSTATATATATATSKSSNVVVVVAAAAAAVANTTINDISHHDSNLLSIWMAELENKSNSMHYLSNILSNDANTTDYAAHWNAFTEPDDYTSLIYHSVLLHLSAGDSFTNRQNIELSYCKEVVSNKLILLSKDPAVLWSIFHVLSLFQTPTPLYKELYEWFLQQHLPAAASPSLSSSDSVLQWKLSQLLSGLEINNKLAISNNIDTLIDALQYNNNITHNIPLQQILSINKLHHPHLHWNLLKLSWAKFKKDYTSHNCPALLLDLYIDTTTPIISFINTMDTLLPTNKNNSSLIISVLVFQLDLLLHHFNSTTESRPPILLRTVLLWYRNIHGTQPKKIANIINKSLIRSILAHLKLKKIDSIPNELLQEKLSEFERVVSQPQRIILPPLNIRSINKRQEAIPRFLLPTPTANTSSSTNIQLPSASTLFNISK